MVMYEKTKEVLEIVIEGMALPQEIILPKLEMVEEMSDEVRRLEGKTKVQHVDRLAKGVCSTVVGLTFLDSLKSIEHIAYRAKKMSQSF